MKRNMLASALMTLALIVPNGCTSIPEAEIIPLHPDVVARHRAELTALPRVPASQIRQLDDWLRVSGDRRALYLNLAYVGPSRRPAHDNACHDASPIAIKGNFRVTFEGPGHEVYCNPQNNWALLDIGWLLSPSDSAVVMCANVVDKHEHWSQHGAVFAPGIGRIGGATRDAFNFQFTHSGDGLLELVSDQEAARRRLKKRPC
jgi:hypothetical protein